MRTISNTRTKYAESTSWVMRRAIGGGFAVQRQFMYVHKLIEMGHYGRDYAAQALRRARAELRADAANAVAPEGAYE